LIRDTFGIDVHPRTIERAVMRRKKRENDIENVPYRY
jgi:hypothetical protein